MIIIKHLFTYLCILILSLSAISRDKQEIKNATKKGSASWILGNLSEFISQNFYVPHIPQVGENDTKMTLEVARYRYVSSCLWSVIYPPNDFFKEKYEKLSHKYIDCVDYDCYVFDLEGYDTLKFYLYVTKAPEEEIYKNSYSLIQTLFVDEALKDTEQEFNVGDNIETVKSVYPDLQVFKHHLNINGKTYYFEILNKNGIYCYTLVDNIITSKNKIDILEVVKYFTSDEDTGYFEIPENIDKEYIEP